MARIFQDLETNGASVSFATAIARGVDAAAKIYRDLTGVLPEAAVFDSDDSFDRHVLASILALASSESGPLTARSGLTEAELGDLHSLCFANRSIAGAGQSNQPVSASPIDADEMELVRDLLLANRSSESACGRWLASMMARRAMEPNHLWEDLGLRDRSELTRLISRHFAPLAVRNDKNMRWKRFFYRMMCEDDGFVMCSTPVCSNCADYNLCFGAETGTSRISTSAECVETSDGPTV